VDVLTFTDLSGLQDLTPYFCAKIGGWQTASAEP
jgi:hypothetical protein